MADLDFYEDHMVNLVALSMACASERVWTAIPLRRRKRWERRALVVVFELLADKTIVGRLPVRSAATPVRLPLRSLAVLPH